MMRSRNSTTAGLTAGSPNAMYRVARKARSPPTLRTRSVRAARRPVLTPRSTGGAACRATGRSGAGSQSVGSTPPAAVEISTAPVTLVPNSSGCWRASAMIVIPPIEWPTSTTGAGPGATAVSTAYRSAPSWEMVQDSRLHWPDRPWPR